MDQNDDPVSSASCAGTDASESKEPKARQTPPAIRWLAPVSRYFGPGHHAYIASGAALLVSYEAREVRKVRLRATRLFFPPRTKYTEVSDVQIQALARSYECNLAPVLQTARSKPKTLVSARLKAFLKRIQTSAKRSAQSARIRARKTWTALQSLPGAVKRMQSKVAPPSQPELPERSIAKRS